MASMYFVFRHIQVLRNNKNHSEGFMQNESFRITKNIRRKEIAEASIILDIANQKIIKNRFTERTFEELFKYAVEHYSDYINRWTSNQKTKG